MAGENVSSSAIQTTTALQTMSSPAPSNRNIPAPPQVAINLPGQAQNYPQSLLKHGPDLAAPRPFAQNPQNPSQQQQVSSPAMVVQSNETSHLQGGHLPSQGLMAASLPSQPAGYQPSQMMRPAMGRQKAIHPQYTMQARTKAGQVSSQFQGAGIQVTRPSGPVVQPTQCMQSMQTRQQQPSQQPQPAQPPLSLQTQQKMPGKISKVSSLNSLQSGLTSSQSLGGLSNLQAQTAQHAWGSKPVNQMPSAQSTYQSSLQVSMNQQGQLGRASSSSIQRLPMPTSTQPSTPKTATTTSAVGAPMSSLESGHCILGKRSIQELVAQVTTFACKLAKHRKSNVLEAKDILLHLNRNWGISIPGFSGEDFHAYRRKALNETHKQYLALLKKSMVAQ